jgi:predicted Zn-dependent protease with MMP-like domain
VRAPRLAAAVLLIAIVCSGCLGSGPGGLFAKHAGAKDFLSSRTYTKWVIEVDVVQGMDPPGGVLDLARSRMESLASKPDGVEFRTGAALPPRGGTWSDKDILDYADAHQDVDTGGKTAALHMLFLDGQYSNGQVLGVTYMTSDGSRSGPVAIFSQRLRDLCGPVCLSGTTPAFKAVVIHELGHSVGLVNNGIPMASPHEDAAHPGHSANDRDVMYYAAETSGVFNLVGGPPTDFDSADRADVCKAGGKC